MRGEVKRTRRAASENATKQIKAGQKAEREHDETEVLANAHLEAEQMCCVCDRALAHETDNTGRLVPLSGEQLREYHKCSVCGRRVCHECRNGYPKKLWYYCDVCKAGVCMRCNEQSSNPVEKIIPPRRGEVYAAHQQCSVRCGTCHGSKDARDTVQCKNCRKWICKWSEQLLTARNGECYGAAPCRMCTKPVCQTCSAGVCQESAFECRICTDCALKRASEDCDEHED